MSYVTHCLRRQSIRLLMPVAVLVLLPTLLTQSVTAAPVLGVYKSDDMDGGVFLTGRWTEGYVGNDPNGIGNGAHAGSWDGTTLYTHWELAGPTLTASVLYDFTSGGNGVKIYQRSFDTSNATLILKSSPWWTGAGDGDYTVDLDYYAQTITVQYVGGVPVFASSVESLHGAFLGFPGYALEGQATGAFVGQGAVLPAGYPSWIPAGVVTGGWGDVALIRFQIAPEPATLGLVGAGLAVLGLRRRR